VVLGASDLQPLKLRRFKECRQETKETSFNEGLRRGYSFPSLTRDVFAIVFKLVGRI
jgi:hypothetical protein